MMDQDKSLFIWLALGYLISPPQAQVRYKGFYYPAETPGGMME